MPSYTVFLLQILFNLTTLFSSPIFFCLVHALLDVFVHIPVLTRSFRYENVTFFSEKLSKPDETSLLDLPIRYLIPLPGATSETN